MHPLRLFLVNTLHKTAEREKPRAWRADGVAVCGIKPELPHPVIFAGFPPQGGMKSQVGGGIFAHGSLHALSGLGLNGSGVYPHLCGRQNRRSHLKPFEKNRQANLLCARQNIPQQRGIRGGE